MVEKKPNLSPRPARPLADSGPALDEHVLGDDMASLQRFLNPALAQDHQGDRLYFREIPQADDVLALDQDRVAQAAEPPEMPLLGVEFGDSR